MILLPLSYYVVTNRYYLLCNNLNFYINCSNLNILNEYFDLKLHIESEYPEMKHQNKGLNSILSLN